MASPQKHIYFVRHGESEANAAQILGKNSATLSEKGKSQADIVGRRFLEIPTEVIVSSSFVRARQTAEHIQAHINVPIVESDLFVERKPPTAILESKADDQARLEVSEIERKNLLEGTEIRHSDEETFSDFRDRMDSAIAFLQEREETCIAVVSHSLVIKMIVFRMVFGEQLTPQLYHKIVHGFSGWNTGITYVLYGDDERFHVRQWNDSAHLGEIKKGAE